jgi:hypothetical protein
LWLLGTGRERERAAEQRSDEGKLEALRKQASRFKEQVTKQQQVWIPRPILPFYCLAAVLYPCYVCEKMGVISR